MKMELPSDTTRTGKLSKKTMLNWKQVNREMARENAKFGREFVQIREKDYPPHVAAYDGPLKPLAYWRNRNFFVQVCEEPNGAVRISVNRTQIDETYNFVGGITWDELFIIKNEIGYADKDCIEIYPAAGTLVNVANIRHLFVLDQPHPWNWKNDR